MGCANAKEDPPHEYHGAPDRAPNDQSATPHASPQDDSTFSPLLVAHPPAQAAGGSLGGQSPRTLRTLGRATSVASPLASGLNPLLSPGSFRRSGNAGGPSDDGELPPLTVSNLAAFLHADTARLLRLRTLGGPAIPGSPRSWEEVLEEWFDGMPVYPEPIPDDDDEALTLVSGAAAPDDAPSHSPAMDALLPRAMTNTGSVAVFCSRTTRKGGRPMIASGIGDAEASTGAFANEPSPTLLKSNGDGNPTQPQPPQPPQRVECAAVPTQDELADFYGETTAPTLDESSLLPLTQENIKAHEAKGNTRLKRLRAKGGPAIPGQPRSWFEVMDEWQAGAHAALVAGAAAGLQPPVLDHDCSSACDA